MKKGTSEQADSPRVVWGMLPGIILNIETATLALLAAFQTKILNS